MTEPLANGAPGRSCPLHYRYTPEELVSAPRGVAESALLIAGGVYGNPHALESIVALNVDETARSGSARLVFNGDFNWFNSEHDRFVAVNRTVLAYDAIAGNVELELAHPNPGAGCGCAYPNDVPDSIVERSNDIMARLQRTAQFHPEIRARLATLPRYLCLEFHGTRIVVLHGDAESVAGWSLGLDALRDPSNRPKLARWFEATDADIFACTHTCQPALRSLSAGDRRRVVINNGAAGMGNFQGDPRGIVTRIANRASLHPGALYRATVRDVTVEAIPVEFDMTAWQNGFQRAWPPGSAAYESYFTRIVHGTALAISDAVLLEA